jgi:hypothetical protein
MHSLLLLMLLLLLLLKIQTGCRVEQKTRRAGALYVGPRFESDLKLCIEHRPSRC